MAAAIEQALPDANVTMLPGGRGDFIVTADTQELWNKRQVGRFPENDEIVAALTL